MRVIFHKQLGQIFYFYSHSNLPLQKYLTLWNWCSYCGYWFHFGLKKNTKILDISKSLKSSFSFSDICWPSLIFAGAAEIVKYISCPSSHCNGEQLESPILAFSMQSCVRSDASSPERCIFSLCEIMSFSIFAKQELSLEIDLTIINVHLWWCVQDWNTKIQIFLWNWLRYWRIFESSAWKSLHDIGNNAGNSWRRGRPANCRLIKNISRHIAIFYMTTPHEHIFKAGNQKLLTILRILRVFVTITCEML